MYVIQISINLTFNISPYKVAYLCISNGKRDTHLLQGTLYYKHIKRNANTIFEICIDRLDNRFLVFNYFRLQLSLNDMNKSTQIVVK